MLLRLRPTRSAATAVECAITLPIALVLFLGLAIGTSGVFRYQQVATLCRAAARYASTHRYQDRKEAKLNMGTPDDWRQDIYDKAIKPKLIALDQTKMTVTITWPSVINQPSKSD